MFFHPLRWYFKMRVKQLHFHILKYTLLIFYNTKIMSIFLTIANNVMASTVSPIFSYSTLTFISTAITWIVGISYVTHPTRKLHFPQNELCSTSINDTTIHPIVHTNMSSFSPPNPIVSPASSTFEICHDFRHFFQPPLFPPWYNPLLPFTEIPTIRS